MVSSRLGIPIRTLQRRLKNDGLTYSRLVADVRCEAACRLLKDPSSGVAGIATALGYADPSNFSRAFQRWTGISPRQYQQQIEITPSNVTKN
ncbi:MAG: helix-turn-helix domain-containing protein [Gammaproteobacteria bacterium]